MLMTSSPVINGYAEYVIILNMILFILLHYRIIMYHRYVFIYLRNISHYERTNERTNEGNNIIIKHGVVIIRPNFAPVIERGLGNTKVF